MELSENTPRIKLRTLDIGDSDAYFDLMDENRAYFAQFNNTPRDKYLTIQDVRDTLSQTQKIRWGIYAQSGELIGTINITLDGKDETCAEVGYLIAEKVTGKGYATEALHELLREVKGNYAKLRAETDVENIPSQRVLEKAGFERTHKGAQQCIFEYTLSDI